MICIYYILFVYSFTILRLLLLVILADIAIDIIVVAAAIK